MDIHEPWMSILVFLSGFCGMNIYINSLRKVGLQSLPEIRKTNEKERQPDLGCKREQVC